MEDEQRQKIQDILEKEHNKFKIANNKEDNWLNNKKKAQIETVRYREDIENKAKEVEIRNDRIFKNQTVYKKGLYEMPNMNNL